MMPRKEAELILRIIEYAMKHDSFVLHKMYIDLLIPVGEHKFIEDYLLHYNYTGATKAVDANHILGIVDRDTFAHADIKKATFKLLPNAFFNYVDYLEIQLARENAEAANRNATEAHKQSTIANNRSMIAIYISILTGVISTLIGLYQILHDK